jgi:hypothetical protein
VARCSILHYMVKVKVKVKVKLSLCLTKHHAMKTYWGNGGIAPRILDLGTRWRWVVSFAPRPLYPQGMSPWYPLGKRLGGPQSCSGRGGEEKNSQPPPPQDLNPRTPIVQPIVQRYTNWVITAMCTICILQMHSFRFLYLVSLGVHLFQIQCSSVGTVTRLGAGQPGFDFRQRHRVQTGSGAHSASCPIGAVGFFPRS